MQTQLIEQLGTELYQALVDAKTVKPLTDRHPDITIEDAYKIQQQLMKLRLNAGERVIGKKIGVTSKAVMNMLGVYQPDFGYLTDGMVYNEGQAIPVSRLIQPKAEGEIAFKDAFNFSAIFLSSSVGLGSNLGFSRIKYFSPGGTTIKCVSKLL